MKLRPLLALAVLVAFLPSAGAASIAIVVASEHEGDHVMKIPRDTRRAGMDFVVKARTEGFVCVQAATLTVNLILSDIPKEWAGASFSPSSTTITFEAGEPGLDAAVTPAGGKPHFDMFWGENAPLTGAAVTYPVETDSILDGACMPSPSIIEGATDMKAAMEDAEPAPLEDAFAACQDRRGCDEPAAVAEPSALPSLAPLVVLVAIVAAVALRRKGT